MVLEEAGTTLGYKKNVSKLKNIVDHDVIEMEEYKIRNFCLLVDTSSLLSMGPIAVAQLANPLSLSTGIS